MKKGLLGVIAAGGILVGFAIDARHASIVRNDSPSIALGYYRLRQLHEIPKEGELILLPPPETLLFKTAQERKYFRGNLLKRVAAGEGDMVCEDAGGVRVNGRLWPLSAPQGRDPRGNALPVFRIARKLNKGELLLLSDNDPWGFDSRYFGPVQVDQVRGVLTPLWTW